MAALVIRKAEPISTKVMIFKALGLPEESVDYFENILFLSYFIVFFVENSLFLLEITLIHCF